MPWNNYFVDQLDWHWQHQFRKRLSGLVNDEYFWEPVKDAWTVRARDAGSGTWTMDYGFPKPSPPPVTTIAWRLAHITVEVFGARNAAHFGAPSISSQNFTNAGNADEALAQLDAQYAIWIDGVRSLGDSGLAQPCGPSEGSFAEAPMAGLVLHVNREVIHHGAEIALLRDLYLRHFRTSH